jgi:hypothetical protein
MATPFAEQCGHIPAAHAFALTQAIAPPHRVAPGGPGGLAFPCQGLFSAHVSRELAMRAGSYRHSPPVLRRTSSPRTALVATLYALLAAAGSAGAQAPGQVPERQAPERQAPEKQAPEKQAPEKQAPEGQAPSREIPGQTAPSGAAPEGGAHDGQAPSEQGHWQTLTGAERSFSVELPAAPAYSASELRTGAGAPYTLHQYVVDAGNLAYVVQATTYPPEVNLASPRANLQGGLDNAAKSLEGGRWASVDWLSYQGQLAVSAIGVRGSNAIRSFSVLKGRQLVTLTFAGPPGSARSADADRFIGSLKLDQVP